jgi:transposase InsO family protein
MRPRCGYSRRERKLHHWAKTDPGRRFDDLHNLVYDPSFLVVAWNRVRGNTGARTAGVDGIAPRSVGLGAAELLTGLRVQLKAGVRFIEAFYNPLRRHSRLGNLSPAAYEHKITTQIEVSA